MDNTYYILSKEEIEIERFHFCTWDISKYSYVEFGVELKKEIFENNTELELFITSPIFHRLDDNSNVFKDLSTNLSKESNCRFIFNDVVNSQRSIGGDSRNGVIYEFESRDKLTMIPCLANFHDGYSIIYLKKPQEIDGNIYFRFMVKLLDGSVSEKRKTITKTNHIYDVKLNENRNIPDNVFSLKKNKSLQLCKVSQMFCLHAIPDDYDLSFIASTKLKNIRKLEIDAFKNYIPDVEGIKEGHSNIIFLKDKAQESYSFFTIITEESISPTQLAIAVATNILCSLLFAISSIRCVRNPEKSWWSQIPFEYWIALGVLIILCLFLFLPWKKWFRK